MNLSKKSLSILLINKFRSITRNLELSLYDLAHARDGLRSLDNEDSDQDFVQAQEEVENMLQSLDEKLNSVWSDLRKTTDTLEDLDDG
jgi:hypothetical protein